MHVHLTARSASKNLLQIPAWHPEFSGTKDGGVVRSLVVCTLPCATLAATLLVDVAIGAVDASRSERYVVPDSDTIAAGII
jgi:hypothetical protein